MRQLIGDFDFDLDPMQAGVARIANRYFERDFFSNSDSVQMLDIARRRLPFGIQVIVLPTIVC